MPVSRCQLTIGLFAGLLLATSTGCQIGRTAGVANRTQPQVRVADALTAGPAREIEPQAIQLTSGEVPVAEEPASADSWSRWIPKIGWPTRVPLPRTDLAEDLGFGLSDSGEPPAEPADYEF